MSSIMLCAWPHSAEPIRKMTIDAWNSVLRPNWSPSLPHSGVDAVVASRYAVTTQDRWLRPPRSPTMVGSAVATMVWSSAASRIASMRAVKMMSRPPRGRTAAWGPGDSAMTVLYPY